MGSERWLRCGAEVVTPNGIQTVSTYEVNGPLVWTEDEYGNTSMWSASALRPLDPVPYREHARVLAERDRLRRELEALRAHVLEMSRLTGLGVLDDVASDIDDILSGGES